MVWTIRAEYRYDVEDGRSAGVGSASFDAPDKVDVNARKVREIFLSIPVCFTAFAEESA